MLVVELYSFYSRIRPEVLSGSLVIAIQGVTKNVSCLHIFGLCTRFGTKHVQ